MLDGFDNEFLTRVADMLHERFQILKDKLTSVPGPVSSEQKETPRPVSRKKKPNQKEEV